MGKQICLCCGDALPKDALGQTRYCSERCRAVYRGRAKPYVDKACGYCGVAFKATPDNNKRYCSGKCRRAARTVREGGTPRPYDRPQNLPYQIIDGRKQCRACGNNKPVDEFGFCEKNNKYRSSCKTCEAAYSAARRAIPEVMASIALYRRLRRHAERINGTRNRDRVAFYIRDSIRKGYQSSVVKNATGFSINQLKRHLERQFTKGMTWEVFNTGAIHIDHIIPISNFDLSNPDEVKACWELSNLRPMWAKDNIRKSAKVLTLL